MGQNSMQNGLLRFSQQIENLIVIRSIRRGLVYLIPLILPGSFALLIISLPIPAYQDLMLRLFGSTWQSVGVFVRDGTFNILSLLMVISVGYAYANEYNEGVRHVSPLMTASVSLASFAALVGITKAGFNMSTFGVIGLFTAMVSAILAAMLFTRLYSVKALRIAAFTNGAGTAFNNAATAIIPMTITITLFAAVNYLLERIFNIPNIQVFLSDCMVALFSRIGSPFLSGLLFIAMVHLFWMFGMHGSNIMEPVAQKFFVPGVTANHINILTGQAPTHIVTKSFFDSFVLMGGCGAALCLLIAILIMGRQKNTRNLVQFAALPVLFNINELLVLGLPVVLNPVFIIPFLGVPVLLTVNSYLAAWFGLVPLTSNPVEWTTPVLLSGYAATGSWRGCALQLVNLAIGTLCYMPFVSLLERLADSQTKRNLDRVYRVFEHQEQRGVATALLNRQDDVGMICRRLLADLEGALAKRELCLHYQPQADYEGKVIGLEALLRWKHNHYGPISPPLVIALAEEADLVDKLGEWIIDQACADLRAMHDLGLPAATMAVNISALQLEDPAFLEKVQGALTRHGIEADELEIEITERIALAGSPRIHRQLEGIQAMGVRLSMDDFGMGHGSLMYLKEYHFNTVKLDGALIRELLANETCSNIVSSITALGEVLGYTVIAEYVETEQQKQTLHALGCDNYQGYLYSKALPFEELTRVLQSPQLPVPAAETASPTSGAPALLL